MDGYRYFRRCHMCGNLNQSNMFHIERCEHCAKPFAQFQFFDDRAVIANDDAKLRSPPVPGQIEPIRGITVFWDKA